MCKLPLSVEVCGYCIPSPPARTQSGLLQAGFVCVTAISFSRGIFAKLGCTQVPGVGSELNRYPKGSDTHSPVFKTD